MRKELTMAIDRNLLAERDIKTLIHPFANLALHRERGPLILERGKGI
jgi:4-aminobutyrate--pyruvate transaminase